MQNSATPRPWAVETIKVRPDLGERMLVKSAARRSYVADTFIGMENKGDIGKAECEANAELIVKAVNHHDALVRFCERFLSLYEPQVRPTLEQMDSLGAEAHDLLRSIRGPSS